MYASLSLPPLVTQSIYQHEAAAQHHEEAAEFHRQAAAHYMYGDYQQANEHARSARAQGIQAEICCAQAME